MDKKVNQESNQSELESDDSNPPEYNDNSDDTDESEDEYVPCLGSCGSCRCASAALDEEEIKSWKSLNQELICIIKGQPFSEYDSETDSETGSEPNSSKYDDPEMLTTLSLKCSMVNLVKVLNVIMRDYENPKQAKLKKFKEVVEYFKPHREFLARTNTINVYLDLEQEFGGHWQVYSRKILQFLFWLCFENVQSKKLRIDDIGGGETYYNLYDKPKMTHANDFKLKFVRKSKIQFDQCTELHFKTYGSKETNAKRLMKLFNNMPNLKKLTVEVLYHRYWCYHFNFKALQSSLEMLDNLQELKLKFQDSQHLFDFLTWINDYQHQSVKYLSLDLTCSYDKVIHVLDQDYEYYPEGNLEQEEKTFDMICNIPEKLINIKHFEIIGWCMRTVHHSLETCFKKTNPIETVKIISLEHATSLELQQIENHFKDVEELRLARFCFEDKPMSELSLKNLINIHKLVISNTFTFDLDEGIGNIEDMTDKEVKISTCLKLFPNLVELEIYKLVQEETLPQDMTSLKQLKISEDKLQNPKILLKLPNLKFFSQKWSSKLEMNKEAKEVKPYLPLQCKIYQFYDDAFGTEIVI